MERMKHLEKNISIWMILQLSILLMLGFSYCTQALAETTSVSRIALNETNIIINRNKTFSLKATVEPKKASNKKIEWISTDPAVATVKNGNIKAIADGECDIICKALDGSDTQNTCHVTVIQMVKELLIKEKKLVIPYAGIVEPEITIKPEDATNPILVWNSSDENVCTVDNNGRLYGNNPGDCVVSVLTVDGSNKKVDIKVHVNSFGILTDNTVLYDRDPVKAFIVSPNGYLSDLKVKSSRYIYVSEEHPVYSIHNTHSKNKSEKITFSVGKDSQTIELSIAEKQKEYLSGDYYYVLNTDNTAKITYYKGDTITEIPSEIDGHTVTELGSDAFREKKAEKIIVPNTVKKIGHQCFTLCEGVKTITLSSCLEYIGDRAFSICRELQNVTIPASVKYIDEYIFYGCRALQSIMVEENNPYYCIKDGGLIDRRGDILYLYPLPGAAEDYNVLYEVKSIAAYALSYCEAQSIVFPENVKFIGSGQFTNKLENAELKGVEVIGRSAFAGCGLKSIILPNTLKEIKGFAFYANENLLEIEIPANVERIASEIFGMDNVRGRKIIVTKGSYAEKFCIDHDMEYILK